MGKCVGVRWGGEVKCWKRCGERKGGVGKSVGV